MVQSIPVTLLSGFLGSGKTTLLNHLLAETKGRKIAVVVNDLSAVNIDAGLIARTDQELVELSNGCICCTLRDELIQHVVRLAQAGDLDGLVIESTGVSEPLAVAHGFVAQVDGQPLRSLARLDTLVTVVDAPSFLEDFHTLDRVEDRNPEVPSEDRRDIAVLLAEQIEFADVLIVNKVDLVDPRVLPSIRSRLRALNPQARVIETVYGKVAVADVLNTESFDYETSMASPAWQRELEKPHIPETVEYGIANFTLESDQALHPERFFRFFAKKRPELLRAKGWFHLATQPGARWLFHIAGSKKKIEFAGWDDDLDTGKMTQLVFIGLFGKKLGKWKHSLEKCLVRPGEKIDPNRDPFRAYWDQVVAK